MTKKKVLSFLLGIIVIILWFYLVDIEAVFTYLDQINGWWIIVAITLSLLHTFISAYKLTIFLNLIKKLSTFYIWGLLYIGAVVSLLTSFPAGGFSMAYLLKTRTKIGYHKIVGILLVDYMVNVLVTIIIAFVGILYFIYSGKLIMPFVSLDKNFYIIIGLGIIGLTFINVLLKTLLKRNIFFNKLFVMYSQYRKGIILYKNNWNIIMHAIILACINASIGGLMIVTYYKAFSVDINYIHVLLSINILSLLNTLPGLPFKLGQYELLSVITLPTLLSIDKNLVFTVAFIEHSINLSISFLLGFIAVYFLHDELISTFFLKLRDFAVRKGKDHL